MEEADVQGLSADDARAVIDGFSKLEIALTPSAHLLTEAYNLAITHHRTAYDSLYLALSIREGCQFVTADERFVNSVSTALPTVVWLAKWRDPTDADNSPLAP
ncbi:MAG TPA: type II toxin-antitoxin system VapC family toxin [Blastocatellia bacterium]|nr:type II toxin-antitoxin system VapC family toxin [Blastocatellia bacterium]